MNSNMLKSIFFFVVIFIATNSIGQTKTLSFEDYNSYYWNEIEVPEGAYIKDTKNILNKFEGRASLTEQTDGWCRFSVEGPGLDQLCSLICNINTRDFLPDVAVRTSIEHIGCFLLRFDANAMHVIGPRSYAESLHHALETAAKSVAF